MLSAPCYQVYYQFEKSPITEIASFLICTVLHKGYKLISQSKSGKNNVRFSYVINHIS